MYNSKDKHVTDVARYFLRPANAAHRQYEALRAYFVDGLASAEAARRFGYSPGSFRVLCHHFRKHPHRDFFRAPTKGPPARPKKSKLRERIIDLRKKNLSIYDIAKVLGAEGPSISPAMVGIHLRQEGFARLPRRRDEERPPGIQPDVAAVADARQLDLTARTVRTQFGGLFLFLPYLAQVPFDAIVHQAGLPGTEMIPAGHALRSLLALKLFGNPRHSHVMSYVFDEALGLFAGLNVIPKRSFLTEYSCRIDPACYPQLMRRWFDAAHALGLGRGVSFDLDFHTIPSHGEDALLEKHYVSKRSRRQKGILAFLAHDAGQRVFCYANANLRKADQSDEVLRFVEFWQARTGRRPEELVFDSRLTTYPRLSDLNRMGIRFLTLRRRSRLMLRQIAQVPASRWRRIELDNVTRTYRTPRILDERVRLSGYEGEIRQLTIAELGHEEPTLLLTNAMRTSPAKLVGRYAQRMIVENSIADGIDFFHMDALSSTVALKVNCDLQLTLMASSLYRLLGGRVGNGYQTAKSRHIFRDFVDASAAVEIGGRTIDVRFQKRARNPLLIAAGYDKMEVPIPWLGGKRLRFVFG
jgi:transposase